MATRQYIGARYVPLFDGDWNSSKVYEPLVIVSYNDSTYTSKKAVPAGIIPTNTEYWALTGTTSGAILDLQHRVGELEDNEEAFTVIKDTTTMNDGGHAVLFGDSWTDPRNYSWDSEFADLTGYTVHNYAKDGYSFYPTTSGTISEEIDTFELDDSFDKNEVNVIVLVGGINDYNRGVSYQNLASAINSDCARLMALCPNAKIYLFTNQGLPLSKGVNSYMYSAIANVKAKYHPNHMMTWFSGDQYNDTHYHLTTSGASKLAVNVARIVAGERPLKPFIGPTTRSYADDDLTFYAWFEAFEDYVINNVLIIFKRDVLSGNKKIPIVDTNLITGANGTWEFTKINEVDNSIGAIVINTTDSGQNISLDFKNCKRAGYFSCSLPSTI